MDFLHPLFTKEPHNCQQHRLRLKRSRNIAAYQLFNLIFQHRLNVQQNIVGKRTDMQAVNIWLCKKSRNTNHESLLYELTILILTPFEDNTTLCINNQKIVTMIV